jgi:hypothetical protein
MGELDVVTPWSAELALDDVVRRLGALDRVVAVSFLGSTGTDRWTDASDYDLCLLLRDYPSRLGVEDTIIDGRVADVVLVDVAYAVAVGAMTSPDEGTGSPGVVPEGEWPFVRWLAQSRPVLDPDGIAAAARQAAELLTRNPPPVDETWQQTTRSFVTHDLRVNAMLLRRADDPVVRVALGVRQLNTFVAAVNAWFTARGLHQEGWKKDMAVVADKDPAMFDIVARWLAVTDPRVRHELYASVVERSLDPIGGPLPPGHLIHQAEDVWETLSQRPH